MTADPSKAAAQQTPADGTPETGTTAAAAQKPAAREAATSKKSTAKKSTAKKSTAKKSTAKKPTAKKATATKAAAKKATATKAAAKTPKKQATTKPSSARKKKPRTGTSATTKPAAQEAATAATSATPATPANSATTTAVRPARGAFAAGAARASGERRRRSGTPLIPTAPVELSAARRTAVGAPPSADEVVVAAVTEGPTEPETAERRAPATPGRESAGPESREPGKPVETLETVETVGLTDSDEPSDALPAEPTPPRRPSRASMRSTRRTANGEPTRLRAVPTVETSAPADDSHVADVGTRHTQASEARGREHALTSGLQSRAEKLVGAVLEGAEFSSESRPGPTELVELAVNVLRAAATSAGVPAEEAERQVAETLAYLRRRLTGDYVVDEFGFDEDYTVNVHLPLLRPFYKKWFRVEVRGIENIPDEGGALVVGNHSGTIAMDSLMTQVAVYDEHPRHRHLRMLGADLVFQMPFVGTMARRSGTTLAANSDAERLLGSGALVGVWPEGFKGVGKPFSERYKLQRFGRGGFVSAALRAGVPIVPVSIVGAEEIYPILGNMPAVARLLGLPYAPITPTFPLLGPLGMVPLPSKWLIEFGPPIETTSFGPDAADDPMLVFDLTDQVRETIQQTLYSLLMQRKSVFL
ncbi:lysophospholipid acyltransferase family protein [Terrabacter tumescens]|uniref:lysophospholipid acyltransferase family protein n=1 Tax=Terrabacter tumescens TaxID=60443 RepID=UPI001E3FCBDC|nr:lysophospholipid acyltransferase family protein [Terrabacter tumescens]